MSQYIPDLTERFPEGMNGVDMTDSYFPSERHGDYMRNSFDAMEDDYSEGYRSRGYEPSYEEILEDERRENEFHKEEETETRFKVGDEYRVVGIYGGVTYYTVKEINENRTKILLTEHWFDIDGDGERKPKWHKLEMEDKHERALEWTSKEYGDFWIYAKEAAL